MKHRVIYNLLLTILLIISSMGWLLAGISVGIQMVPNPTAQLEQTVCLILMILSAAGILAVNIIVVVRRNRKGFQATPQMAVPQAAPPAASPEKINEALQQITFETKTVKLMNGGTDYYVSATCPSDVPREIAPVIETLNDLGARYLDSQWSAVSAALDGKGKLPYWAGSDSMEITVEADGTWFREQEEWRASDGTKLPNDETKKLFLRFIAAEKEAQKRR